MTVEEHASQLKNQVKEPYKKTVIANDKRRVCFFKLISVEVIWPIKSVLYGNKNFWLMLFFSRFIVIHSANLNMCMFTCCFPLYGRVSVKSNRTNFYLH